MSGSIAGRLLWITERYPPAKGGMSVSCFRQVGGLRRLGFEVDVLTFAREGPSLEILERDGGADLRVRRETTQGIAPNIAWTLVAERHAARPYKCIVGFGASFAGFLSATYAAWLQLPSVPLVRGNDLDRDWFLARRGGWLRESLSRAAVIGAVSAEKVERIRSLYPEKTVVWTPNGVDAGRWELLPADARRRDEIRGLLDAPQRRIVGLFGDLKAKKGVPFWLEAVRDQGLLPAMSLLVVGNPDEATARLLDDPALAPKNIRIPFCSPNELPGFYAACDFVAIPSAFEGMPNVLLEAMACGVTPLVSGAGALGEVVVDGVTGFLFPAGNRELAGQVTARALAVPDSELREMSARVRADVARRFSLSHEIDVLVELLGKAMG